jgi:hypothetical protein
MPIVPVNETRSVNGRHYVAGEEYPDRVVEIDKARIESENDTEELFEPTYKIDEGEKS